MEKIEIEIPFSYDCERCDQGFIHPDVLHRGDRLCGECKEYFNFKKENAELKDLLKWCWEESIQEIHECPTALREGHWVGGIEDCKVCQTYNKIKAIVEGK